eukprot:6348790-Pyramimonas_sp.AAC.1
MVIEARIKAHAPPKMQDNATAHLDLAFGPSDSSGAQIWQVVPPGPMGDDIDALDADEWEHELLCLMGSGSASIC